jgi:hypothetical protein
MSSRLTRETSIARDSNSRSKRNIESTLQTEKEHSTYLGEKESDDGVTAMHTPFER